MLALCFLSKGLENQSSQHLDTRRWFPHTASDSTSFRGKKREHASKPRCGWWTGCFWQAQEKATHSLGRESIHLPMQQNKTNGDSRRRESRKEHHNKVDKHTAKSFFSLFSSPYRIEVKAFWCREKYLRGFSNNASPCHWCRLLLLYRRLSLWAEQRCMFLPSHYHLNMWAFKKQIRMFWQTFIAAFIFGTFHLSSFVSFYNGKTGCHPVENLF